MAKSKEKNGAEFKKARESDRLKEIEEYVPLEPATEQALEQFDNIEDYWRAMEKIQKIKKQEAEAEKKKKVKEILEQEEKDIKPKDPDKMTAVEKFYWQFS